MYEYVTQIHFVLHPATCRRQHKNWQQHFGMQEVGMEYHDTSSINRSASVNVLRYVEVYGGLRMSNRSATI
jgi:hypothetical protein